MQINQTIMIITTIIVMIIIVTLSGHEVDKLCYTRRKRLENNPVIISGDQNHIIIP